MKVKFISPAAICVLGSAVAVISVTAADPRNVPPSGGVVPASGGAIIDNGTIKLGVHDQGHLNLSGGIASIGGTTDVGLRFITPAGEYESTSPGCLCEGWGAGATGSGLSGGASVDLGGVFGIAVNSFTSTASTAVSDVNIGSLKVVQDYHPSTKTANLYENTVTLTNEGGTPLTGVRYSRVMDWDVEPTPFSEYVTIKGTATTTDLIWSHDDGFESPEVLGGTGTTEINAGTLNVDFTDSGPNDHGAYFLFEFGDLDPGESKTFQVYYGAAADEAGALAAIAAESIELFSMGQPSSSLPTVGTPQTTIFGFKGVGGVPVVPIPESSTYVSGGALLALIGFMIWRRKASA